METREQKEREDVSVRCPRKRIQPHALASLATRTVALLLRYSFDLCHIVPDSFGNQLRRRLGPAHHASPVLDPDCDHIPFSAILQKRNQLCHLHLDLPLIAYHLPHHFHLDSHLRHLTIQLGHLHHQQQDGVTTPTSRRLSSISLLQG